MAHRVAGSFVLFLQERSGLTPMSRFEQAFGATLDQAEADWLELLL